MIGLDPLNTHRITQALEAIGNLIDNGPDGNFLIDVSISDAVELYTKKIEFYTGNTKYGVI